MHSKAVKPKLLNPGRFLIRLWRVTISRRMIFSLCEEKRQSEKVLINMQVERVKEKKISSKTSSVEFYSELFVYSLIFPFWPYWNLDSTVSRSGVIDSLSSDKTAALSDRQPVVILLSKHPQWIIQQHMWTFVLNNPCSYNQIISELYLSTGIWGSRVTHW